MRMARQVETWIASWASLFGLYLLLTGKLDWAEFIAGAVAAGLGVTGASTVAVAGRLHFRPRLGWLRHAVGLPRRVLADCAIVAAALYSAIMRRCVPGSFRTIPFDPGDDSGESAARRALVAIGVSIAPNTFVVAIDREHRQMLVHELVRSSRPPGDGNQEWPL
jgi:multisubunit Na+/H+ antiporter MnhE subunit